MNGEIWWTLLNINMYIYIYTYKYIYICIEISWIIYSIQPIHVPFLVGPYLDNILYPSIVFSRSKILVILMTLVKLPAKVPADN